MPRGIAHLSTSEFVFYLIRLCIGIVWTIVAVFAVSGYDFSVVTIEGSFVLPGYEFSSTNLCLGCIVLNASVI